MRCIALRALAFTYRARLSSAGSVAGCAARHEARHSPRLRLAPPCSQPRPRPGVAELGVVRRRYRTVKSKTNIIVNRVGAVLFFLGVGGFCSWNGYQRGYPWFHGVGIALVIIGS